MASRQCHHCKEWIDDDAPHDCWTTTEGALTQDLSENLREAWERLRETAGDFGEQRIYASHHCIMFSRQACYFFVRPKRSFLEVVIFLGRVIKAPQVRRTARPSKKKIAHIVRIRHRDEVEPPITDWLLEAYESSDALSGKTPAKSSARRVAKAAARTQPNRRTARTAARKKR